MDAVKITTGAKYIKNTSFHFFLFSTPVQIIYNKMDDVFKLNIK